jgi:3'(2'), 5'-bisphosphate nucleotidase
VTATVQAQASDDATLAAQLAELAGALLLDLRSSSGLTGTELGERGDSESNTRLLLELSRARPNDAVLSEEAADDPHRLESERVWIIDPLDGTREFGMAGRPDWAVHVALWQRGQGITAAAVAQPALQAVYDSHSAQQCHIARERLRFLVSESRPPAWASSVADQLGADLAPMGSAGAKAMAVLRGEADAYLHDGGQWEWDSAAPVGVALAAGLHASRIDGRRLVYNSPHPYLPDLVICRPEIADRLLRAIGSSDGH